MKKIILVLTMMTAMVFATVPTQENITKLYIATFDRAPDAAGLRYWTNVKNISLEEIAKAFFDQKETEKRYPKGTSEDVFIEGVYNNLFKRPSDSEGKSYWKKALESNKLSRDVFLLSAINGALGDDARMLENKTKAGLAFAQAGRDNLDEAVELMRGITADEATLKEALEKFGLQLPGDGNDNNGNSDIDIDTSKIGGWYGRTVVSAEAPDGTVYTHSTAGVFGELVDSDEAVDQHDIPAYGPSVFQVVFPQESEDYFSNYQSFSSGDKKTWTFQIKNQQTVDLKDAPITIALPEVKKVSYKKVNGKIIYGEEVTDNTKKAELTLIDVDNATSYTVDQLATANLTMGGLHTRTFKWVLGTVENDDYTAAEAVDSSNLNITRARSTNIAADGFNYDSVQSAKTGGKFGLPPM